MEELVKEIADRLDEGLFSIAGILSGILQAPGPMTHPTAMKLLTRSCDLSDKIKAALPSNKRHLVDELANIGTSYCIACNEQEFLTGMLLGAMLAGKSKQEAIGLAGLFKPREELGEEDAETIAD